MLKSYLISFQKSEILYAYLDIVNPWVEATDWIAICVVNAISNRRVKLPKEP